MGFLDGIGSFFSGILGIGSNLATNSANMKMNKQNLDVAKQMFQKEMDYNRYVYEDQKEYNSASAQRQRIEDAGMNPYMMMSGGSAGTAGSSSSPSFSMPSTIPRQSLSYDPSFIQDAIDKVYQNDLVKAESDKTRAEATTAWEDAQFKRTFNEITVARELSELRNVNQETKSRILDNYIKQNTADYTIQSMKYDSEYKFQQIRDLTLDMAIKDAGLPFISKRAQLEIDNLASDLLSKQKQRELTARQIENVYAETLFKNKQRLNMPNLDRDQADKLAQYMVESAFHAAYQSGMSSSMLRMEKEDKEVRYNVDDWLKTINSYMRELNPLNVLKGK